MKLVLDTSVVFALLASDEERDHFLDLISKYDYVCSKSIVPELGNAISAMFKRGRIDLNQGLAIVDGFSKLDIQFVDFNLIGINLSRQEIVDYISEVRER